MRTVFCLFDSLNKSALGCYGGRSVATPNFDRFAARSRVYDNHYVGSLPCMPARRDMHTGRLNFFLRSWGPLEPFDNSFPRIMREAGIYSHLVTDHLHYFEAGGSTYHGQFTSYDFIRGQEYDPWKAMVQPPVRRFREKYSALHYPVADRPVRDRNPYRMQHAINHEFIVSEDQFPGPKCFASGFEFLDTNRKADDWFLMIECFDPHEPFRAPERFREAYKTSYEGGILDWPIYARVTESEDEIAEIRANYAALVAMCDYYFGKLLDYFDAHDLWKDTTLILSTDHGLLLSEHDWWGKNLQPYYQELANIPLIIHNPKRPDLAGTRTDMLTQTHDLMPTFLDIYDLEVPAEVQGESVSGDTNQREVAVYGMFGGPIGVSDAHHSYYIYPENLYAPGLHEYTLMPMHLTSMFSAEEMKTAELHPSFQFTKGMPILKIDALKSAARIPIHDGDLFQDTGTQLYDLIRDPKQENALRDSKIEAVLRKQLVQVLHAHDCPTEIYGRYDLSDLHNKL